jgi:F-type H+-transporting ATPase subunit epsilon
MSVQLTIVTPEGEVFAGAVDSVVLPGSEGEFGVLQGHERFLSALRLGSVAIHSGGNIRWAAVSHGFADVGGEDVVVLVDRAQLGDKIDRVAVESERAAAEASLRELDSEPENHSRRRELHEIVNRTDVWLDVAKKD